MDKSKEFVRLNVEKLVSILKVQSLNTYIDIVLGVND